jgi:hypothetical protein
MGAKARAHEKGPAKNHTALTRTNQREGGIVPAFGETTGGHGVPVALAPEEGVALLLPSVGEDGLEEDGAVDGVGFDGLVGDPVEAPFVAPGNVPHGDPLGVVPVFGVADDGPLGFEVEFVGDVLRGTPLGFVDPGVV